MVHMRRIAMTAEGAPVALNLLPIYANPIITIMLEDGSPLGRPVRYRLVGLVVCADCPFSPFFLQFD